MTRKHYETSNEYIKRLEAKIAELEFKLADAESYFDGVHTETPKTCDGRKWNDKKDMHIVTICMSCVRTWRDRYEPKDTP